MQFLIADTFTDSLARLTGEEQKVVKTTAFDLQMNPENPGMKLHKLDKAKDKNFWSVRVNDDLRIIVHKTDGSLLLCFVGRHDPAYRWAERRRLETHPKTGAAQLVEVRERVEEVVIRRSMAAESIRPITPPPALFDHASDDELLGYGVPKEWLGDVRAASEDALLELVDHLPGEAAEALLDLAIGVTPQIVQPVVADPFNHPDALRRFRTMSNLEELERALEYPWEKWTIFLHPTQRQLVERDYGGPARVSGSAGTGKTIVALHRAVFLARSNPDARVLLTTFSETLANSLRTKLRRLISNEPRLAERLEVHAIDTIGRRLYEINLGHLRIAARETIKQLLEKASGTVEGHKFRLQFLLTEWEQIVDAWQLDTWEAYRDVTRLGRKTRLREQQRNILWSIFDRVRSSLVEQKLLTYSSMFSRLASHIAKSEHPPFDFAIVDESQDINALCANISETLPTQ